MPVAEWFSQIPNPTLADAILDRLVHTAYRLQLLGESLRENSVLQFGPCRTLELQYPYQPVPLATVRHAPFCCAISPKCAIVICPPFIVAVLVQLIKLYLGDYPVNFLGSLSLKARK